MSVEAADQQPQPLPQQSHESTPSNSSKVVAKEALVEVSRKRKSYVWTHYRRHPTDEAKVVCWHCYPASGVVSEALSYSVTTSSNVLARHLENKHRDHIDPRPKKRARQTILTQESFKISVAKKAAADKALMRWMVMGGRPLSFVRDSHFKSLASVFGWTLPSEESLKNLIDEEYVLIKEKVLPFASGIALLLNN